MFTNDALNLSILPDIGMNPVGCDLAGTGPNGETFSRSVSSGSSATISNLASGEWTVLATAEVRSFTPCDNRLQAPE